jgi:hypothetical protein
MPSTSNSGSCTRLIRGAMPILSSFNVTIHLVKEDIVKDQPTAERDDIVTRWPRLSWERFKDLIIILTPIAIAGLGGIQWFLKKDHENLKEELLEQKEMLELDDRMLKSIESYLDRSSLSETAKTRVYFTLMHVRTSAFTSKESITSGKQGDVAKKIPFLFALLTNNSNMLADIGATTVELALWLDIARQTGSREIKMTSLRALDQMWSASNDPALRMVVAKSYRSLNIPADDPELGPALLRSINTFIGQINFDAKYDEEWKKIVVDVQGLREDLKLWDPPYVDLEGVSPPTTYEKARGNEAESRSRAAEYAIESLLPKPSAGQVAELIVQLDDNQPESRSRARSDLARIGHPAVSALVSIIGSPEASNRSLYGAVSALALMKPQIDMKAGDADLIVKALGHIDNNIHTSAAQFLIKVADAQTCRRVKNSLIKNLTPLKDENDILVETSVFVLGNWLNRDDLGKDVIQEIRTEFKKSEEYLRTVGGFPNALKLLRNYMKDTSL